MILEAVWFKDGKEVAWVDPVSDVSKDFNNIENIAVGNGDYFYSWEDFDIEGKPDDFVIRIKKEIK